MSQKIKKRIFVKHNKGTTNEKIGIDIYIKYENRQHTGAFKVRGSYAKLLSLSDEEKENGVVAMSAGNHAQGLAFIAKKLSISSNIVMPEGTPFTKIRRTKNTATT